MGVPTLPTGDSCPTSSFSSLPRSADERAGSASANIAPAIPFKRRWRITQQAVPPTATQIRILWVVIYLIFISVLLCSGVARAALREREHG